MTDFPQPCPQQYFDEDQFHGNSSPAAGPSWSATTLMAPQHLQTAPSSDHHPLPAHWDHAGILQDDMFPSTNVAGDHQVKEDWEGMCPSVEDPAAQDQLQDQQCVAMEYYDMAYNDFSPPYRHHDHIVPDYARVAQDVLIQAHVVPPAPATGAFNDNVQHAAAGPAPALFNEVPHQDPVPNGRASEVLRQLALLYLNDPNSQLVTIRMGPGHNSEVTVDISLKVTNL
ncbi:hypothetical protein BGY98DRAFT_1009101 [Russula aff. rugulosa BPL654]|nr:hypothetical protein BGY98DRAFT_1009101 [Russula aff. rugulosa BPL654]